MHTPACTPDMYAQILDSLPHVVMRLRYEEPNWNAVYVNKAVERYGYSRSDFIVGEMTWNDMIHPDDRVVVLKLSRDYMANDIDEFKIRYRISAKNGASIYVTEYSHVNRAPDGSRDSIDSFLFEDLERQANSPEGDAAQRRNLVLNDILLTLQDASAEPEKAFQFILDRVGTLLDCSRVLLFKDSQDHKTCRIVHEWLNSGITSIKSFDYAVTYSSAMPEIYIALQKTGMLLVNAGEIPGNCREEFEAEGVVSSAILAVYQYGDHYGFVSFDDCVIQRKWDTDTVNFLKVIANLLSNIVMNLQSNLYMREYENKIKSLAFRDYLTGLPNHYTYDSDLADAILAANSAGTPAYAVMLAMKNIETIRDFHGLKVINAVCQSIAEGLQTRLQDAVGERGALYRIAGTVFVALVQPGDVEPVRTFAESAVMLGNGKQRTAAGEFACGVNVAAVPFGVKNVDPEKINDRLDAATVETNTHPDHPLVFLVDEE